MRNKYIYLTIFRLIIIGFVILFLLSNIENNIENSINFLESYNYDLAYKLNDIFNLTAVLKLLIISSFVADGFIIWNHCKKNRTIVNNEDKKE